MRPPTIDQNRLGKSILMVAICFVLIFLLALAFRWFKSPHMFQPVFG